MSYSLQPNNRQVLFMSILCLVVGFVLTFFSQGVLINTVRILGLVLLAYGLIQLYVYFTGRSKAVSSLVYGLPMSLIGLFILISPTTLISIFPIVIGIILLVASVIQMQKAFIIRKSGISSWFVSFVIAVALLIGGIVLIMRPVAIVASLLKIGGIFLIAEGLFTLFESFQLNSAKKN